MRVFISTLIMGVPLLAGVIDSTNVPAGVATVNLGFATVTSSPRNLTQNTVNGVTGIGVIGGRVAGEIDLGTFVGDEENITITYGAATTVTDIRLAFLFQPGQWTDTVFEAARITANGVDYVLTVTGNTTATWTGAGSVVNLSPALDVNSGVFRIINPFPGQVTTVRFSAVNQSNALNETNSDFALLRVESTPEPATLVLIGGGLLAVALVRRGRRAK